MAMPKEPRQKMINLMYLVLTALLALNVSAEVIDAFKTVDYSLMKSNDNIETANVTLFKSFEKKKGDPANKEKAEYWGGKADQAKKLSSDMLNYIENLKKELKTASGLRMVKNKETGLEEEEYKLDDLNASSRIMDTEKKGKELDDKLRAYRTAMLNIDSSINLAYKDIFPVEVSADGKDNTTNSFRMMPTVAAITLLSKLQNNVKNAENQVISYAHSKIGEVELRMDQAAVLVGQSSNYVMPGEEVTITAGVGSYSSQGGTTINIGGQGVPVVDGQGSAKFIASGSGEQTRQVTVVYLDQNKQQQTKTVPVKFVVGTPGGAAVMLDKMNVFYIGVDNPVTIGSPTGWDKTEVKMNGGDIQGSGSKRIVKVSALGNASITVSPDGKPSTFQFRIKKIPDPVFKVGDGKIRMQSVVFKQQPFCRAELENFDFDLKFNIVSATVFFSGANFPSVIRKDITSNSLAPISAEMAKCGPGSVISFDNIRVSGPDGTRTIDGKSIALY
jgi:gliding motility-associated protein GldM